MSPVVPAYAIASPSVPGNTVLYAYTFVLISLPLCSFLIPLLLLILFFSTSYSRRTWLFALNVIVVSVGILGGILGTFVQSQLILHPRRSVSNGLFLTFIGVTLYTPMLVDCILILRLSVVYPQTVTKRSVRALILAIPIACTAVRIVCITLLVYNWVQLGNKSSALAASSIIWPRNPLIISDWFIQLFENSYCSVLFMYRLRNHKAFSSRMYREQSLAVRLRAVFYIAASNFVFPAFLSIFQLGYVLHDRFLFHAPVVSMVNNYISIIGIVFCTIWSASDVYKKNNGNDQAYDPRPYFPELDLRQSAITLSGIAPNLDTVVTGTRHPLGFSNHFGLANLRCHASRQTTQNPRRKLVKPKYTLSKGARRSLNSNSQSRYMGVFIFPSDMDKSAGSRTPTCSSSREVEVQTDSTSQSGLTSRLAYKAHGFDNIEPTEFDSGTDLEFVTPMPPPLSRQSTTRLSHSLSLAESDYINGDRHRDSLSPIIDARPYNQSIP